MADMTDQFVAEFGADAFEELSEATISREGTERVAFLDHVMLDACNWVHKGVFRHREREVLFEMEVGDRVGCCLRYGDDLTFTDRKPPRYAFVPKNPETPVAKTVFPHWQRSEWFRQKEGAMNYDYQFAPGSKTREHYGKWADQKGLKIEVVAE